jgi:uncharacterized protein YjbJ (UPF0337 family)
MLKIDPSQFDGIINRANRYYGKVLMANEEIAKDARELILDRVSKGKTTDGAKMQYKGSADKFSGDWNPKTKNDGDYSEDYAKIRSKENKGNSPMDLNLTGGLINAFTYRKSRTAKTFSLRLYIKNTKNKDYKKRYPEIHGWLRERFGDIFAPNKKEVNIIAKAWKKRLR